MSSKDPVKFSCFEVKVFSSFGDVMFPVEYLVKVQPNIFDCFCLWDGVIPEVELGGGSLS